MRNPKFQLAILVAGVAAMWLGARDVLAAKPGGGTPLPPWRYQIQFWQMPDGGHGELNDANDLGQAVGWYLDAAGEQRAYLYDPAIDPDVAIDFTALDFDLSTLVDDPENWFVASLTSVNNHGTAVGAIKSLVDFNPSGIPFSKGFVWNPSVAPAVLVPLPDWQWTETYPRRISDDGIVAGTYWNGAAWMGYVYDPAIDLVPLDLEVPTRFFYLNNRGEMALQVDDDSFWGSPYRWSRESGFEPLPKPASRTVATGINNSGVVCGYSYTRLTNRGPSNNYPFRFSDAMEFLSTTGKSEAINDDGDLFIQNDLSSSERKVYQDGRGALAIADLIDRTDPDAAAFLGSAAYYGLEMTNRTNPQGLGMVLGEVTLANGARIHFTLIPVAVP